MKVYTAGEQGKSGTKALAYVRTGTSARLRRAVVQGGTAPGGLLGNALAARDAVDFTRDVAALLRCEQNVHR